MSDIFENTQNNTPMKKTKKPRKPMTAERKAQLLENLKKGRKTALERRQKKALANKIKKQDTFNEIEDTIKKSVLNKKSNTDYENEISDLRKQLNDIKMNSEEKKNISKFNNNDSQNNTNESIKNNNESIKNDNTETKKEELSKSEGYTPSWKRRRPIKSNLKPVLEQTEEKSYSIFKSSLWD